MNDALVAVDTNVLVYAVGLSGEPRHRAALELMDRLPLGSTVIPVQVLGELFRVLTGKSRWDPQEARRIILRLRNAYPLLETSGAVLFAAADLVVSHQVQIWDAVILAAASSAGCRLLLSEDFQDGFTWGGVTVGNPFAATPHPLLSELIAAPPGS